MKVLCTNWNQLQQPKHSLYEVLKVSSPWASATSSDVKERVVRSIFNVSAQSMEAIRCVSCQKSFWTSVLLIVISRAMIPTRKLQKHILIHCANKDLKWKSEPLNDLFVTTVADFITVLADYSTSYKTYVYKSSSLSVCGAITKFKSHFHHITWPTEKQDFKETVVHIIMCALCQTKQILLS